MPSILCRRFTLHVLASIALATAFLATVFTLADGPAQKDPRQEEVQQLIERYFHSWSNQDIARYGQCFMPTAAVQLVDSAGRLLTIPLTPFLKSQQEAQQKAAQPMTETPESVDIRFEGEIARVVVRWKLIDGPRTELGYDHFTLLRADGKWRIANLLFYSDPPTKK